MNKNLVAVRNILLCLMFFFSGLCGLLYETVWLRLALAEFGVITPIISVIISVFMAGLGLGSWLGGKYVLSVKQKMRVSAIALYGCAEIIIGIGALLIPWLFKHTAALLLNTGDMNSWLYLLSSAIGICLCILPWTFMMGTTYPTVLEFLREFEDKDQRQFGRLYAANTAGAVAGVLLTVYVLVEVLGFRRTLMVAAGTNFLIGTVAILWGLYVNRDIFRKENVLKDKGGLTIALPPTNQGSFNSGYLILFTTGFCLMAMEVVWVRAFAPFLGSLVYSFAELLAIYLAGSWFGSFLYRMNLAQRRVKSRNVLIIAIAISSTFTLLSANYDLFRALVDHLTSVHEVLVMSILIVISVSSFSILLGYLTPLLIDEITQGSPAEAGRAYAINILGCILGPLISGYCLLPELGARSALMLLTLPLLGLLLIRHDKSAGIELSTRAKISATTVIVLIFIASYLGRTWEEGGFLRMAQDEDKKIYRDYAATTVAITDHGHKSLFVNGSSMTEQSPLVKLMAHLPLACLGRTPRSVLVICLGMGTTFRSMLSWDVKTTAVELLPSVRDAFSYFYDDAKEVLKNPNGQLIVDDGRRFLRRSLEKFDVITIDPPPPIQAAASSLLYSTEFLRLIRKHLRSGGILQEWYCPASNKLIFKAIIRSFVESFPYVKILGPESLAGSPSAGYYFLASEQPITVPTFEQFSSCLPPKAKCDLQESCLSTKSTQEMKNTITRILSSNVSINSNLSPDSAFIITDNHPFNEYFYLRESTGQQMYWADRQPYPPYSQQQSKPPRHQN